MGEKQGKDCPLNINVNNVRRTKRRHIHHHFALSLLSIEENQVTHGAVLLSVLSRNVVGLWGLRLDLTSLTCPETQQKGPVSTHTGYAPREKEPVCRLD